MIKKTMLLITCLFLMANIKVSALSWLEKMGGNTKETNASDKNDYAYKQASNSQKSDRSYAQSDLIPGNEIIFEDDLKEDPKGELLSKWNLIEGHPRMAQIDGENGLSIVGFSDITPLYRENFFTIPAEFTIEFNLFMVGEEDENDIEFIKSIKLIC